MIGLDPLFACIFQGEIFTHLQFAERKRSQNEELQIRNYIFDAVLTGLDYINSKNFSILVLQNRQINNFFLDLVNMYELKRVMATANSNLSI